MTSSSFGGVSDNLRYYEFEMDSFNSYAPFTGQYTKENWPVFAIGGKKPLQTIAAIKILEVQIPFTWYTFNATKNTFVLIEDGEIDATVTIPVGNYTITNLLPALNLALDAASIKGHSYTSTYSTVTEKISVQNNNGVTLPFALKFGIDVNDNARTNPRRLIGFPGGSTLSQSFDAGTGDVLLAPFVINISGPNYMFVNSQKVGNLADQYLPSGNNNFGNSGPQLAKVPVNQNAGGIIDWADPDPQKWFNMEGLNQLVDLDLFLTTGDDPTVVDLNGQSFSVKLGVLEQVFSHTKNSAGSIENRSVKRVRNS